jgi:hypothetical protein
MAVSVRNTGFSRGQTSVARPGVFKAVWLMGLAGGDGGKTGRRQKQFVFHGLPSGGACFLNGG